MLEAGLALEGGRNVGVVVPPANPVVEPELNRLLPAGLRLFASRLPVLPGTLLDRNRAYVAAYGGALEGFGTLALDAAVIGMTGPTYPMLPEGDRVLTEGLSRPGRPVQTASGAILEALRALGARRLCLFSPYPQWLTEEAAAYWTAAGHEVRQVVKLSETRHAYTLATADVTEGLRQVERGGVDAIVMSGTGMLTVPAILGNRAGLPLPFLSSNICCAWWLMRQTGVAGPAPLFQALAPELAGGAHRGMRVAEGGFAESLRYRSTAVGHLAYGVSSTPRGNQRPVPIVAERAEGAWITDADGNRFIDYAMGYGPLILGHSPGRVLEAIRAELERGLRTASVHRGEAELAELIAACVPSAEVCAFVSTGTEAVQLALRVARGGSGRVRVVKFRANYHGWFDNVHVAGRPGVDGPGTIGQDPGAAAALTILDWGDAAALEAVLDESFAAVLMEPAAINGGCFPPPPGFLERVRAATRRVGAMLVFDEVITGFRMGLGGAQARYGVSPDLTVLGKALGGGLPIGVVAGTRAAMRPVADGSLFHRGTFNGNPVCVAAAVACVRTLMEAGEPLFARMEGQAAELAAHVEAEAARLGVEVCARCCGPVLQLFAGVREVAGIGDLGRADRGATARLTEALLVRGVQAIPRGLMYLSAAHGAAEITATTLALTGAMEAIG